jgi:murein peptide amidase A
MRQLQRKLKGIVIFSVILMTGASCSFQNKESKSAPLAADPDDVHFMGPQIQQIETPTEILDERLQTLCEMLQKDIKNSGWDLDPCPPHRRWKIGGWSYEGRPLIYAEYGNPKNKDNVTLVISTVHADEITPLYLGFKLLDWMEENASGFEGTYVVVAPLVNPDGLFSERKSRTNARGVDVNRNLPTADWDEKAHHLWKTRFHSNARRNPGPYANSEPETWFQVELIDEVAPHKILSLHAPLNFMDYDGPNHLLLERFPKDYVKECLKLRNELNAFSGGFFPGSLGNYAGQERGIPTLTLELPSANARNAEGYWKTFRSGIRTVIEFNVPSYAHMENETTSE